MGITTNFTVTGQKGITSWLTGGTSIISDEADSWIIGTNVEYSIYVEFGTSSQSAQPYLFSAAEKVIAKSDMYWAQSNDINDFIKKLAMAIERRAKHYCPVDTGNLMNSIEAEKL